MNEELIQITSADVEQLRHVIQQLQALRNNTKDAATTKKIDVMLDVLETMEWLRIERTPVLDITKQDGDNPIL